MVKELRNKYKIPKEWKHGPIHDSKRSITDKLCLLIFITFLILMIVTMIWALKNSNHSDLSKIYDSSGNICGFGETKDFPYLFLQTFEKPYRSVCVKTCPKFDYNEIKYKSLTTKE